MTSQVVGRIAGWSGFGSVLAFVAGIALVGSNSGKDSQFSTTLFMLNSVLMIPVIYALYIFFRPQAPAAAGSAILLGLVGFGLGLIAPTPDSNALLFNASSVLGGISIGIFNYLGFRSNKIPRVLAILGIVLGILSILSAVAGSIGEEIFGLLLLPIFIIWTGWLSWLLLKGKLT